MTAVYLVIGVIITTWLKSWAFMTVLSPESDDRTTKPRLKAETITNRALGIGSMYVMADDTELGSSA